MSSSYFDAQPAKAPPPAALLDIPKGSGLANASLLSPQVSRILEDLEFEEKSSSEDENENASLSGDSNSDKDTSRDRKSRRDLAEQDYSIRKAQTSPLPHKNERAQVQNQSPSHQPGLHNRRNPHLARFHSLRSMLFSNQIENDIQKHNESQMQEDAESKWKAEHDQRRGLNRPKTPESQSPPREGLAKRMKSGLKRMASKDSPPMAKIPEDNVSTASDDEEDASHSNDSDINHSDIEDLVRWVSKRDPPSDGEARRLPDDDTNKISKTDSGHESLGHSDVDDLVRWVSRKDDPQSRTLQQAHSNPKIQPQAETVQHNFSYDSDASTESDSEIATCQTTHRDSINDDDVDDLVRWVSRKEGPHAGPVRKKNEGSGTSTPSGSEAQDSHTEELVRWDTKKDDTSGESQNASKESLPIIREPAPDSKAASKAAPKAGSRLKREVSHTKPAAMESEAALTHDDVDDLVQWVTRKNTNT
ncbi:uncharacterized protein N0V89_000073 [Didymosphaeria variabile]|uniref:Uncharacterized protein n=1 Tax=Didymosphaeria variabile TaxID=1932322 RepID=A0A9W8XU05_9PLEO|nr:uncharacterized protein N0V89_000073 [Didymosphaeria variabile]KAJ4359518.1 hypothetical protein N0V89_000073 [Didymosphaeria variabile]